MVCKCENSGSLAPRVSEAITASIVSSRPSCQRTAGADKNASAVDQSAASGGQDGFDFTFSSFMRVRPLKICSTRCRSERRNGMPGHSDALSGNRDAQPLIVRPHAIAQSWNAAAAPPVLISYPAAEWPDQHAPHSATARPLNSRSGL